MKNAFKLSKFNIFEIFPSPPPSPQGGEGKGEGYKMLESIKLEVNMKRHFGFWIMLVMAFLLLFPVYLTAQQLILESSTGDRIGSPSIKSFSLSDNKLVIYLSEPFTWAALSPSIWIDDTTGSFSECTVTPPATVTAMKDANLKFTVKKSGGIFNPMPVDPDPNGTQFDTQSGEFTWNTEGLSEGSYLAVFSATEGSNTSSLVVMITITPSETVTTPNTPSGPTSGTIGTSYTYSTGGSTSDRNHQIQYRFNWGDGTDSDWLPVGTTSAQKSWASKGTYQVKAQARCASDTSVVSSESSALIVTISETPPPPPPPGGKWASQMASATKLDKKTSLGYYGVENIGINSYEKKYFLIDPKALSLSFWKDIAFEIRDKSQGANVGLRNSKVYKVDQNGNELNFWYFVGKGDFTANLIGAWTQDEFNNGVKFLLELAESMGGSQSSGITVFWKYW